MAELETAAWSGDGDFTRVLADAIAGLDEVSIVRVEDSPASRTDTGYAFLSNEIHVGFAGRAEQVPGRWLGVIPVTRTRDVPAPCCRTMIPSSASGRSIACAVLRSCE